MPADQPRARTVGCKMTDNEYERLSAVAEVLALLTILLNLHFTVANGN